MQTDSASSKPERLVRLPEFLARVGYKKSRAYDLIAKGLLPAPVRLPGGRAVAWPESVVDDLVDRIVNGKGASDAA